MTLTDGAKYHDANSDVAVWSEGLNAFVTPDGERAPEFQPVTKDQEVPMSRFFVHRYDVVRIKVAVEANSQREAMEKADEYLAANHPIADRYLSVGDDEKIAQHFGLPTWIHYEHAEDWNYYIVDAFGDPEFTQTQEYNGDHTLLRPSWAEHPDYPVDDWATAVANNDTRLGYDAWVAQQKEAA